MRHRVNTTIIIILGFIWSSQSYATEILLNTAQVQCVLDHENSYSENEFGRIVVSFSKCPELPDINDQLSALDVVNLMPKLRFSTTDSAVGSVPAVETLSFQLSGFRCFIETAKQADLGNIGEVFSYNTKLCE